MRCDRAATAVQLVGLGKNASGSLVSADLDATKKILGHEKTRKTLGFTGSGCLVDTPLVPPQGLEPWTHGLRVRCSTN